jgi:hypothetical protein
MYPDTEAISDAFNQVLRDGLAGADRKTGRRARRSEERDSRQALGWIVP